MKQFGQNDPHCYEYALKTFSPEDQILQTIIQKTKKSGMPEIQVGPMEGLLLEILVRSTAARKIVEIGTLAGYSTVCMARGLPENGKIWTFEMSEKHALVAQENFQLAGVSSKIQVLVGPALERLASTENEGPFDLVFIDANKNDYVNYLNWAVKNVRIGGSILADNTFAWCQIAGQSEDIESHRKPMVESLRNYNKTAADHPQLRTTIIPTFEGLTFSVRVS